MKLLGIGDNVLDDYRWRQELYPGGNSVNVPRRYDGSTAAYIGVLADDGAGLHFASALREEGVDISRVRVMHGVSARNYIELDEAGDRHFVGNNGRETAQYQALLCLTPGDYAMMEQYDLAHTSIHSWLDAYHPAISRRVPLSLDFSGEYDRVNIAQLCPLLRFAFFSGGAASEEEAGVCACRRGGRAGRGRCVHCGISCGIPRGRRGSGGRSAEGERICRAVLRPLRRVRPRHAASGQVRRGAGGSLFII